MFTHSLICVGEEDPKASGGGNSLPLGIGAVSDQPLIIIHKENPGSAAATILKHIKPSSRIKELIILHQDKLEENENLYKQ